MNLHHVTSRLLPVALALVAALPMSAADDFGIWSGIAVQKDFSKKFSVDAALGFRAEDCLKQATRWDISVGADYKPLSWLGIGASYSYIYAYKGQEAKTVYKEDEDEPGLWEFRGYNVDHAYWRSRHRVAVDLTGKVKAGHHWTFSLRERYQYTHYMDATTLRNRYRKELPMGMAGGFTGEVYEWDGHTFTDFRQVTDDKPAKDRHLLRSRVAAEYNIRHCPFTPYASLEFHNELNDQLRLDKTRLMAGVEWKITKKHRMDLAYVFQHSSDDDDAKANLHALSVEYKFKF